jgi:hypothetical protein
MKFRLHALADASAGSIATAYRFNFYSIFNQ